MEDAFDPAIDKFPITGYDGSDPLPANFLDPIVELLNNLLQGPSLFDTDIVNKEVLGYESKRLASRLPGGSDLIFLNRLLLEDTFSETIEALPPFFYDGFQIRSAALIRSIAEVLNDRLLMLEASLYDLVVFEEGNITLREKTRNLINTAATSIEFMYLNRLLLEDAFPGEGQYSGLITDANVGLSIDEWLAAWVARLNHLLLGPALTESRQGEEAEDILRHNRVFLEEAFQPDLAIYKSRILLDLRSRPYARFISENVSLPSRPTQPDTSQTHLRIGSQIIP